MGRIQNRVPIRVKSVSDPALAGRIRNRIPWLIEVVDTIDDADVMNRVPVNVIEVAEYPGPIHNANPIRVYYDQSADETEGNAEPIAVYRMCPSGSTVDNLGAVSSTNITVCFCDTPSDRTAENPYESGVTILVGGVVWVVDNAQLVDGTSCVTFEGTVPIMYGEPITFAFDYSESTWDAPTEDVNVTVRNTLSPVFYRDYSSGLLGANASFARESAAQVMGDSGTLCVVPSDAARFDYFSSQTNRRFSVGSIYGDSFCNGGGGDLTATLSAKTGGAVTCRQAGTGGDELQEIQVKLESEFPYGSDDFVIIQGGINNIQLAGPDPNAVMRAAVKSMVSAIEAQGMPYLIVNVGPFGGHENWTSGRQAYLESYNNWLKYMYGCRVVDMYSVVDDGTGSILPAYDSDGLHLNPTGASAVDQIIAYKTESYEPRLLIELNSLTNAFLTPEDFTTNWAPTQVTVTANSALAPNGWKDADEIKSSTAGGCRVTSEALTLTEGVNTISVFLKPDVCEWVRLRTNSFGTVGGAYFDLANGAVGSDYLTIVDKGIEPAPYGYYRCWIKFDTSGDNTGRYYVDLASADGVATAALDDNIHIWGAQIDFGDMTSYRGNDTYGNLITAPEDFTDSYWTASGVAVTANDTTAPNGDVSADKITATGSGTSNRVYSDVVSVDTGDSTISVYLKAGNIGWARLRVNSYDTNGGAYFDLTNGVVGSAYADIADFGIESALNGFYRCWIKINETTDLTGRVYLDLVSADGDPATVTGDYIHAWGGMVRYGDLTGYAGSLKIRNGESLSYGGIPGTNETYIDTDDGIVSITNWDGVIDATVLGSDNSGLIKSIEVYT